MRSNGFALWLAGARVLGGEALSGQGHTGAGVALTERGVREWRALGTQLIEPFSPGVLTTVLAADGRIADALAVLAEALQRLYEPASAGTRSSCIACSPN
ncbi:MAG: hypothetical protein ABIR94_20710 [Rubrivivax sp.]